MGTTTSTKIQPLLEDLERMLPGTFLKSTEYKRWLVEKNLDEVWASTKPICFVAQLKITGLVLARIFSRVCGSYFLNMTCL